MSRISLSSSTSTKQAIEDHVSTVFTVYLVNEGARLTIISHLCVGLRPGKQNRSHHPPRWRFHKVQYRGSQRQARSPSWNHLNVSSQTQPQPPKPNHSPAFRHLSRAAQSLRHNRLQPNTREEHDLRQLLQNFGWPTPYETLTKVLACRRGDQKWEWDVRNDNLLKGIREIMGPNWEELSTSFFVGKTKYDCAERYNEILRSSRERETLG
jgi:hypothetical protein